MIPRILRLLAPLLVLAAPLGAAHASCPSTTGCPIAPQTGTQPCNAELGAMMERAARNELGAQGPDYGTIGQGCPSTASVPATIPCALTKAISYAESSWRQFCSSSCGQSGLTVISFDCGYGLTQVTSGMSGGAGFEPLLVAQDPLYNLGAGMKILAGKWRATPCVGDNQPTILEHWYFATWAYNSFSWRNNPNNPEYPATRPPYNGPGTLSRGSYPYQEIVWGYMRYPPSQLWPAIEAGYPNNAEICNTDGCRPGNISEPSPIHRDPCQAAQPDAAELASEDPPNPVVATSGASVTKRWSLRNTGGRIWSKAEGYSFVRTSPESLGAPASVDLPDGATYGPGQTAELSVTLTAPASGSGSVTFQLEHDGSQVGPDLVAVVNVPTAQDADGDGHASIAAGGDDCDDADPAIHPGAAELCDGKDQTCDGVADESLTRACNNACGEGVETCAGGAWAGCTAPAPGTETCDGRDEDCDGTADNGELCPPGQDCVDGACKAADPGDPDNPDDPIVYPLEVTASCGCSAGAGSLGLFALVGLGALAIRRENARSRV